MSESRGVRDMHDQPTAEELLAAFDSRIYAPTGRERVVLADNMGWGGSRDALSSLSLKFLVGAREESVIVEVSIEGAKPHHHAALQHLVFEATLLRRPRFPIVIERGKVRIPVEGRERVFTTYTAGPAAVAVGSAQGVDVMVRCPTSRLQKLSLGILDAAELRRVFRNRERRLRRASRRRTEDA